MDANRGLSQEGLKLIACVSMLADHIGAVFVPVVWLRIAGRLAFPIYCFLLAEGMARTRDVKKYGLRLAVGAVLSELPYDLLFYEGMTLAHQSVMVTLLLGYGMILWMRRMPKLSLPAAAICALAAKLLRSDYGAMGVLLIAVFYLSRELSRRELWQGAGLAALCWLKGGGSLARIPVQLYGVLAMVPICLYTGKKATSSRAVQWGFYLFYPLHLAILLAVAVIW